jgi:hypothetical protein
MEYCSRCQRFLSERDMDTGEDGIIMNDDTLAMRDDDTPLGWVSGVVWMCKDCAKRAREEFEEMKPANPDERIAKELHEETKTRALREEMF